MSHSLRWEDLAQISAEPEKAQAQLAEYIRLLEEERRVIDAERKRIGKEKEAADQAKAAAEKAREAAEQAKAAAAQEREQLKQEKTFFQAEKGKLEQEKRALEAQKKALAERDRQLTEREINAENGFAAQNEKALASLKSQISQLQNQIEKQKAALSGVQKEFDKARAAKEAELDRWAEEYRALKMQQAEKEIAALRQEAAAGIELLKKTYEESVRLREKELESLRQDLEQRLEELNEGRQALLELKQELEEQKADLEAERFKIQLDQKLLDEQRAAMDDRINKQVQKQVSEIQSDLEDSRKTGEFWKSRATELETELAEYKRAELLTQGRSKEELQQVIDLLEKEVEELKNELKGRPDKATIEALERKARSYDVLWRKYLELAEAHKRLESEQVRRDLAVSELELQKELRLMEEKRVEAIKALAKKYEEDVERLKSQFDQTKAVAERIRVIELPVFEREENRVRDNADELDWLAEIHSKCRESGLHFNERLLYSFHTALKTAEWSPLTVLAGVSGTGKSELPKLYSRFGGLYFLSLPVKPDWDSPQSLFGYFNSIDNKYNATPLLRAMTQFQDRREGSHAGNLSDRMLLVLLDEMNLAHVELYFSDLLSKLEMRRGDHDGQYIEIDIGPDHDRYQVQLSRNVLWVGTMNEDETTKSLSDKVLDRGNLISFPRPVRFESRKALALADSGPMLKRANWNRWLENRVTFHHELEEYKLGLEQINEKLELVGRALGHRVWQSIENYVANHPLVIRAAQEGREDELQWCIASSFEEAVVHKVMPKLRGIDTEGNARIRCLEPIGEIIAGIAPGILTDYQIAKDSNLGFFMWKSAKYLEYSHEKH
jgi:hypothetical protein